MEHLFIKIFNMSVTATYLILVILILRRILKNIPKSLRLIMWAGLGIRLVCPFSFKSIFSLIPSHTTITDEILYATEPTIDSGIPIVNTVVNPILSNTLSPHVGDSINPMQILTYGISIIWIIGIIGMLLYSILSCLKIHRKIKEAIPLYENIFLCDHVETPFIFGILHPSIYLPSSMNQKEMEYVLAHEKIHLKHYDYILKPFAFLLLSIHWFNPFVWLAYSMFCKDLELICDEYVIRDLKTDDKKEYLNTLVNCSVENKTICACPIAFAEIGVKERIQAILNYKKPTRAILMSCLVICILFVGCLLSDPKIDKTIDGSLYDFLVRERLRIHEEQDYFNFYNCIDIEVLGVEEKENEMYIYALEYSASYSYGLELNLESGGHIPMVYTVKKDGNDYELIDTWNPEDGANYGKSIKEKFPLTLEGKALNPMMYVNKQKSNCEKQALQYFESNKSSILTYIYEASVEQVVKPTIILNTADNTFEFTYSMFSSYIPTGSYMIEDDQLILKTRDGKYKYVFLMVGSYLTFDASQSSEIPSYKYSENGILECPVPEWADFRFVVNE